MKTRSVLANLSERQLLTRFGDLVRRDRRRTAQMLAFIAEIDQRRLWAKHACPSMFAFCVRRFHMSESTTAKRIWAARTARRFPLILTMVARGELHLTAIVQLATHLTEDNHRAVLLRAKHKSSREIEQLVAELAPRPDVPSRIWALPSPAGRTEGVASESTGACGSERHTQSSEQATPRPSAPASAPALTQAGEAPAATSSRSGPDALHAPRTPHAPRPRRQIVVLAPRRYKIEITVDQQTHDNLRKLQDLLSHQIPDADPAIIVSRAIDRLLEDTLKRKAAINTRTCSRDERADGSEDRRRDRAGCGDQYDAQRDGHRERQRGRQREQQREGELADRAGERLGNRRSNRRHDRCDGRRTRAIPATIRREVWRRDGGRCTFVDEQGQRCGGTRRVEYHHEIPYGKGGRHEARNIALRCQAHNQYQADLDFGRKLMRAKRCGNDRRDSARNVGRRPE